MKAPVGPQAASNTPTVEAITKGASSPRLHVSPQPSALDRFRATTGQAVKNLGVESNTDRALRLVAERYDLDNVTPADATAYVDRAGAKPVSVIDLGGGNVAGLARLAKDTPGLARRQIPSSCMGAAAARSATRARRCSASRRISRAASDSRRRTTSSRSTT
jgi:hypothetical protein